jgi:hypothetical protein
MRTVQIEFQQKADPSTALGMTGWEDAIGMPD